MIKKYNKFIEILNENLSYTNFFGKEITHEHAIKKRIKSLITNIAIEENSISEKDFTKYDNVINLVNDICDQNEEIYLEANIFYNKNKRLQFLAEKVWEEYFKTTMINENIDKEIKDSKSEYYDVAGKVKRSRKIPKELKDRIIAKITDRSKYINGKVFDLSGFSKYGCSLGADKNGFFCYTHRARSKSYESSEKIPKKDIKFIESTG